MKNSDFRTWSKETRDFTYKTKKTLFVSLDDAHDQCTGISDRTGFPIYENDIVQFVNSCDDSGVSKGTQCLVRWNKFLAHYELDVRAEHYRLLKNVEIDDLEYVETYNEEYQDFDESRLVLTGARGHDIVVVGNLHENPEFLNPQNENRAT